MKIKEKILLEIKHEGVTYLVPIDAKQDIIIEEDNAWDADVDYMSLDDKTHDSGNPYPYFTIWGVVDGQGVPTLSGMHALINYENYDMRIDGSKIKVVEGT